MSACCLAVAPRPLNLSSVRPSRYYFSAPISRPLEAWKGTYPLKCVFLAALDGEVLSSFLMMETR